MVKVMKGKGINVSMLLEWNLLLLVQRIISINWQLNGKIFYTKCMHKNYGLELKTLPLPGMVSKLNLFKNMVEQPNSRKFKNCIHKRS